MSENRVQIAVVGVGRMGRRHVHSLLYRVPYAHLVAVCTNEPHEIEWAESNAEYSDFGIKAVWVSSSTDVHSTQTRQAIEKGMRVLCEKPLSIDLEEAQTVINAAKQHSELKAMAGFSRRFDSSYRDAAQKIYQEQAIGKPILVRSQTCDLLDTTGFFVKYASRNGAIFVDCVIHDIDLALW